VSGERTSKGGTGVGSLSQPHECSCGDGVNQSDAIWKQTPFVDFPGTYGSAQYRFEWEREWRVPHGVTFQPDDVAFLFIPESLLGKARSFFD
jgi:hypothetical protein